MDGWLIVRHPVRETCGGYRFTIFGSPPDRGGPRPKLGEFCGGDLHITNAKGQSLPDLLLTEASPLDPNDTTPARVVHLHRVGSEWMIMKTR